MAKTKAPVDPDAIALLGKKKDAQLLARYALENGAASLPFLERAFAEGSQPLRIAATVAIAALDAERAERLVLGAIAALGKKWTSKPWKLAHELLLLVATPTAIATFLAAGETVKTPMSDGLHAALLAHVLARAPRADSFELRALLQQTCVLAHPGGAVLEALEAAGVTIDLDLALEASAYARPGARVGTLSKYLGEASARKAVALTLTHRDDRAWVGLLAPYIDEPEVFRALVALRAPIALEKLRATASREAFDGETQDACYRLGAAGDAEASPILLRWLEDPIAASEAAPMLLTALAACGDALSVPIIARARAQHPRRAAFFDHAMKSIRERIGP